MKRIGSILFSFTLVLAASIAALMQTTNPPASEGPRTIIKSDTGVAPVIPALFETVVNGGFLDGRTVTNKPVSAVLESETVRMLPGGATNTRRVLTRLYRDAAGRTRREQIFYTNGETPSPSDTASTFSIFDPVARWNYSVNPLRRIAARHRLPAALPTNPVLGNQAPLVTEIFRNPNTGGSATAAYTLSAPVTLALGKQTIAGVEADGWRVIYKIPPGALGNAAQIETVYEAWIAADLQMLVKCTITSPVSGTLRMTATSLSRTAPASSLFTVPAGYATSEMGTVQPNATPPRLQR